MELSGGSIAVTSEPGRGSEFKVSLPLRGRAQRLCREIHKHWPEKVVEIYPTKGLCSFYAERNGVIVSYM